MKSHEHPQEMRKMNPLSRGALVAFANVALTLALGVLAVPAVAQDEDDTIRKKDKTTMSARVKSEDLKGAVVIPSGTGGKAEITIGWKDIASIDYAGSPDFRKARGYVEAGNMAEAIPLLEALRKESTLRDVLKNNVLFLLGSSHMRAGEYDKAIEVYSDLFTKFPKTQYLLSAGDQLINAHLAKQNQQGAKDALESMLAKAKAAGIDTTPLNVLKGRVFEAAGDYSSALSAYKTVFDAATDDAGKAAAELGMARALFGQGKFGEADAKYRALTVRDLPPLVLAGAWNGLGDLMLKAGKEKRDVELITDSLYAYLRGCVLYTPQTGEPTAEYERAVAGAYECFKGISEIETVDARKKTFMARAKERREHLETKFPNSRYLPPQ